MTEAPEFSGKTIVIDCRELEPPEPMVRVLEAVQKMADNEAVLMVHRKYPRLLIPRLDEMKLSHRLIEESDDLVKLLIWKEA